MLSAPAMQAGPGMLREFVLWWARQMRAFLPKRLVPDATHAAALIVTAGPRNVALSLRRRGRETELGEYPADDDSLATGVARMRATGVARMRRAPRRVIVRVGPGALLERPVEMPLAAERDLDRIIGFEMDRLTPFVATEVVWNTAVAQRDVAQRRLNVRLSLVPRRAVQPCLDLLSRVGLHPAWVEAAAADGTSRRLDLAAPRTDRTAHRALAIAGGVVAALAAAVIVTPFVTLALARAETEHAIAMLQPQVARVEALRQRIAADSGSADALTAERTRNGDALQVLAAVTDIVPDDSWLTEFSLRQGKLGLSGQSPAAAQLIVALGADPAFRNPAFAAPVTRAPDGHADLFVIRAELAP
jgi:general secretion pathway protein L